MIEQIKENKNVKILSQGWATIFGAIYQHYLQQKDNGYTQYYESLCKQICINIKDSWQIYHDLTPQPTNTADTPCPKCMKLLARRKYR